MGNEVQKLAVAGLVPVLLAGAAGAGTFPDRQRAVEEALVLDHEFVLGEVLVRFEPGVSLASALGQILLAGAASAAPRYARDLYLANAEASREATIDLVEALAGLEEVEVVEPNYLGAGGYTPNDPVYPDQWHLEQESDVDIDASAAWSLPQGDAEVVIAVLDSGTRFDQTEIESRLKVNQAEDPSNGLDDDGNGLVDDWRGWDFTYGDNDPSDPYGHGTAVAGTTLATADNSFQVAGVARDAVYVPIQVLDADNRGTTAALVDALEYVSDLGYVDLVNLSLIDYPAGSTLLGDALGHAATTANLISCAGNGGPGTADSQYPGAHPDTLSVNATDRWDELASFASTGDTVILSAPGVDVYTLSPFSTSPDDAILASGCSYAAPIVTGVAALLHAHWKEIDRVSLETYLAASAVDLGPAGWDGGYGWGRVNAHGALSAFLADWIFADGFESGGSGEWSSSTVGSP